MPRFKLTIEYHGGAYCGWPKHIAQKVRSGFAMQMCGIKRDADAPL